MEDRKQRGNIPVITISNTIPVRVLIVQSIQLEKTVRSFETLRYIPESQNTGIIEILALYTYKQTFEKRETFDVDVKEAMKNPMFVQMDGKKLEIFSKL